MELKLLHELMLETIARLSDANLEGEELEREIQQALALNRLGEIAVVNGYKALRKAAG